MSRLRYVSHPEVEIDPDVPVPRWGLNDVGRARALRMLDQPWIGDVGAVICSDEQKALDTAAIVGAHLELEPDIRPSTHENLRAGYLPETEFQAAADQFFARPTESVHGWERAIDAQTRILDALADVIDAPPAHDVMVIGHGGVGTLLLCALAGWDIDRRHDQPRAGQHHCVDLDARRLVHAWRPIDVIDTV